MRRTAKILAAALLAAGGLAVAAGSASAAERGETANGCVSYSYDEGWVTTTVYYNNRCSTPRTFTIYYNDGCGNKTITVPGNTKGHYKGGWNCTVRTVSI
jgi:hypothetical protein